jgi:hypothetical protein
MPDRSPGSDETSDRGQPLDPARLDRLVAAHYGPAAIFAGLVPMPV